MPTTNQPVRPVDRLDAFPDMLWITKVIAPFNLLGRMKMSSRSSQALILLSILVTAVSAEVPQHSIVDSAVRLDGVGPGNPIIYDNDWWYDVFDNNYLWAQASLGKANLRGNIVSRDMWNWRDGYQYSFKQSLDDAKKAISLARESGLKNIPDLTSGSDQALVRPPSGRIEDTMPHPTDGSRLIVAEAKKASREKPLLIVAGGPQTTVANAILTTPEIAANLVVFNLTVSGGYNGKDGWAAYIVAKRARSVDWGGGQFWDKDSVFRAEHFSSLPENPFTQDMKRFIQTNLGRANQLGDGAPLVWLYHPKCWKAATPRQASYRGGSLQYDALDSSAAGDVLVISKAATDLKACRDEFFRVLSSPQLFARPDKSRSSNTLQKVADAHLNTSATAQKISQQDSSARRRVVILTDISNEPDDQQSLVRFLTYTNEFDVEGIIATTSCWRKNDPDIATIHRVIDAYGKVVPNLRLHAEGFPDEDYLHKRALAGVDGYGIESAGTQLDNRAVDHIISVVDKEDARPVWFCVWGGGNTLAAAVMKVRKERGETEAQTFVSKIRGYEIALQDDGFAYITKHYPKAKLISARLLWKGISRTTPKFNQWPESWGGNDELFNADWVRQNVQKNHGPLGEQYLRAEYLHEGDTPSFLYLIPNGLQFPEHVNFGGWGGRFYEQRKQNIRSGTGNHTVDKLLDRHRNYLLYSDATDSWQYGGTTYQNEYCTVFRWREAFQADFAARMDWCVKPFDQANHNPVAIVNGDNTRELIEVTANPGETIKLDATASSDPDGNGLNYSWWVYNECGSYASDVSIENDTKPIALVHVPHDAAGKDFHVILSINDDGSPALTVYRRIVVSVGR